MVKKKKEKKYEYILQEDGKFKPVLIDDKKKDKKDKKDE
jgi:hypothetical protein